MADGLRMVVMVPHPPKIIEELGDRRSIQSARLSVQALDRLALRICEVAPETVIILTPHAPISREAFGVHVGDVLRGSFAHYGCPSLRFEFESDLLLVDEIIGEAFDRGIKTFEIPDGVPLDHGMMVPLYFLTRAGWRGKVVGMGCSLLPREAHVTFGQGIDRAVASLGRGAVFIASGHLSHRVSEMSPAGFDPRARQFDERIVEALRLGEFVAICQIENDLRIRASECGYRPLLVALGAVGLQGINHDVLCYESPFGVGYLVAVLADHTVGERHSRTPAGSTAAERAASSLDDQL